MITAALQNSHPLRVIARLLNFTPRARVEVSDMPGSDRATIILPVLNESPRIANCLDSLIAQPREAAEILVVDGGSTDGTQEIVMGYQARDKRVRLIDASPIGLAWTGKAWGLHVGLQSSDANSEWILCVDADVRARLEQHDQTPAAPIALPPASRRMDRHFVIFRGHHAKIIRRR